MSGLLNSSTVGFQDESGTVGTEVTFNQNFIESNFSWIAQSSDGNIPWLYVSTLTGDFNGYLESDQSEDIYINIITSDIIAGNYSATMAIESDQVETFGFKCDFCKSFPQPFVFWNLPCCHSAAEAPSRRWRRRAQRCTTACCLARRPRCGSWHPGRLRSRFLRPARSLGSAR